MQNSTPTFLPSPISSPLLGLTMSDNAVIGTFGTNVYVIHNKKGAWEQATFTAPVSLGTSVSVADDTASQSTFTVQDNNAVYVNRLTFDANGNPSWTTTQVRRARGLWAALETLMHCLLRLGSNRPAVLVQDPHGFLLSSEPF